MKAIQYTTPLIHSGIALAAVAIITICNPTLLWSAEPNEDKEVETQCNMVEKCADMKKQKQKMRAEIKAQDAELTAAVATMNSAGQEKKIELMGSIVTQLVEQRTATNAKRAKMEEKMMKHMIAHMETGEKSTSKCPMMEDADEKSE